MPVVPQLSDCCSVVWAGFEQPVVFQTGLIKGIKLNLFVVFQAILPQKLVTLLAGILADVTWSPLKNILIRAFIKVYQVDMHEAREPQPERYQSFNEFFTRQLQSTARPVSPGASVLVSPVDGSVSAAGRMQRGMLLQAKGTSLSLDALLANTCLAEQLDGGTFATLYLSPRDYHRVHMPTDATIRGLRYIPGKLFSVNQGSVEAVDSLFARNERLVCEFEYLGLPCALIMVGALIVGGMETVVTGKVARGKVVRQLDCSGQQLLKGDEYGRFYLGSTVITLFSRQLGVSFHADVLVGTQVRVGQALASIARHSK